MDVLKPQLIWIGKRCYRVNSNASDNNMEQPITNEYIEDDLYTNEEDAETQEDFEITEVSANRFKTTIHVPQAFYGALIGAKGSVKKRIEGETRTEITIPKHGSTGDIKILGTKPDAIRSARRRIELIVLNCRRKQRPTHFTCIRIIEPTIKNNYITFKEDILKSGPTLGLHEEMFIHPEKLHFTIGVMVLMDDIDRSQAVHLLEECRDTIVLPIKNEYGQIEANVRGIEIMNDDPSSVKILYGKIESDALQKIGDAILKMFIDAGLAKREFNRDTVKLHMTLINTDNLKNDDDDETNNSKFRASKKFDARHILENYSRYEFGSQRIDEIHLAIMKSKDADGFYKCSASIQF